MRLSFLFCLLSFTAYQLAKHSDVFGVRIPKESFWHGFPGLVVVITVPWMAGTFLDSLIRKERDPVENQKRRHWVLTTLLSLMVIANLWLAHSLVVGRPKLQQFLAGAPQWLYATLIALCCFNIICLFALLNLKRWGFWGICLSAIAVLVISIQLGAGIAQALPGLAGLALVFLALQLGGENKGWSHLD